MIELNIGAAIRQSPVGWAIVLGVCVVAVLIALGAAVGGDGSGANYSATVSGSIPHIQTVGMPFVSKVEVQNTGDPIPNLTVDLSGCSDHWVVDRVTGDGAGLSRSSAGDYYSVGAIPNGITSDIRLTLAPNDAGNHRCDVVVYPDADSDGKPSGDPLESVEADVAINP